MSDSPVSPEDIHAAAEAYRELGPEYHDAVVASFVQKIDREVEARVEARLAGLAAAQPPQRRRRTVRDVAVAGAAALAVVGAAAVVGFQHSSSAGGPVQIARPGPGGGRAVIIGPEGKRIVIPQNKIPQPPAPPAAPPG